MTFDIINEKMLGFVRLFSRLLLEFVRLFLACSPLRHRFKCVFSEFARSSFLSVRSRFDTLSTVKAKCFRFFHVVKKKGGSDKLHAFVCNYDKLASDDLTISSAIVKSILSSSGVAYCNNFSICSSRLILSHPFRCFV